MSVGSNLIGTVFLASEVSEGTATGSGSGPYAFTETQPLASQQVFGTAIGPNATATVTSVTTSGGVTTVTVVLGNTSSFANGQSISGVLLANDANDFLLFGNIPGVGSSDIFVTNTVAQQPGSGVTVTVAGESPGVTYNPACFCGGTMIQTPAGEVPVERLAAGDLVVTASGGTAPVRWVGHRRVDLASHPRRATVQPIRVMAGAFGGGLPRRDLLVSPEHAVFTDGVLIPIGRLTGCPGIERDARLDHTTYFHLELDRHDIVLASGLPCESWLDTGNRAMFENAEVTSLHFDQGAPAAVAAQGADAAWASRACAPLLTGGPMLDAIRHRLGAITTLDLALDTAGIHRFELAPHVHAVRLVSQPISMPGDLRPLGAAVCALQLDGEAIDLLDDRLGAGFHPAEATWRWTDGAARLALGTGEAVRILVVDIAVVAAQRGVAA